MELFVPGFNTTVPIAQPYWRRDTDILEFSQSHLLYFRLQAKKNVFYSLRDRMNTFLWAVTPSHYADVVTTLQTSVNAYRNPEDDRYLPDHLCIDGIASMINNNAKHHVRGVGTPRINRVVGSDNGWDMVDTLEEREVATITPIVTSRVTALGRFIWNRALLVDAVSNEGDLMVDAAVDVAVDAVSYIKALTVDAAVIVGDLIGATQTLPMVVLRVLIKTDVSSNQMCSAMPASALVMRLPRAMY
jgi:hypothetical protein